MHSDPNARCQPRQVHAPRSRPRARMRMALRDARPGDAARAGRVPPDTAWTAGSPRAGAAWVGWFGISDGESHVAVARQAHGAGMRTWITRSPARIGKQDMTSSPGTSWSYGPAERWGRHA